MIPLMILYENADVIVVKKPAQVPSQRDRSGDMDMMTAVADHLKTQTHNDTKPYVGLIHRLDRPVSGVMVFAKTPAANTKLSEQIRQQEMSKAYKAIVCGIPTQEKGVLTDYLMKKSDNLSIVVPEGTVGAKKAILEYEVLKTFEFEPYGPAALLNINLITGRHHQIRVQLAHAGLPIWGDTKYNEAFLKLTQKVGFASAQPNNWYQIALCAYKLEFKDPKNAKGKDMVFSIEPSDYPFVDLPSSNPV